ncbi:MAG: radical SAM protein [Methanocellales archaeon]
MKYEVLFLHPPAIYDFRKKVVFPGGVARTVPFSTSQFLTIPIGFLSMAEYLERHGFKTKIYNLGEAMLVNRYFEVESFLKKEEAKIYALDLHWCIHVQGAIELAKLCKQLKPSSKILLGGLTASCFHSEIIEKFKFIDYVIRGEGEKPLLQLLNVRNRNLERVPNLTYRTSNGRIKINPMEKPCETLDEFDFTRLDLVEPCSLLIDRSLGGITKKWWCIPFCRGCIYNCVGCGASAYSYSKMFNRQKPAFRSPEKIAEDIEKLRQQGINLISIFQDPRMGGKSYVEKLISTLRKEKIDLDGMDMELFSPASEEYLKSLSSIGVPLALTISPESGVESVRSAHGRRYSNSEILRTAELCQKYNIDLGIFFMLALGEETKESLRQTYDFWEKLYQMNFNSHLKGICTSMVKPEFGFMLLLDPGSLAFDFPEEYGYKLFFQNVEDYYIAMSQPSWHLWLSYETKCLGKKEILTLILQSLERRLELEEKYRIFDHPSENASIVFERFKIKAWHAIAEKVDEILNISNQAERLLALEEIFGEYLTLDRAPKIEIGDRFGYRQLFEAIAFESMGLMSGA